ncbi:hypothetical protein [Streptomyces sp. NRRL F-5123]|uniref:hypothetical protein n=1 Tax=Streptomyces sp. NRRL F-5123 TaxID=1463856 RepID=UPI0004E127FC|nr:hypothetical protein [Streptomyces sp. NRRL F-5123]
MSIDWHALGTVLVVTLLSTVGLVGVFTLGVVGLSRPAAGPGGVAARGGAYACFAACAAAVAWGIWLIVAK